MTLWPMTCMALWPVTYDPVAHDLCPCGRWSPGNLVCGLWLICLWLLAYGIITYIGVRHICLWRTGKGTRFAVMAKLTHVLNIDDVAHNVNKFNPHIKHQDTASYRKKNSMKVNWPRFQTAKRQLRCQCSSNANRKHSITRADSRTYASCCKKDLMNALNCLFFVDRNVLRSKNTMSAKTPPAAESWPIHLWSM